MKSIWPAKIPCHLSLKVFFSKLTLEAAFLPVFRAHTKTYIFSLSSQWLQSAHTVTRSLWSLV